MNEFSPYLLRKLLRYEPETGKLYWLERSIDVYPEGKRITPALVAKWNKAFAGREAFTASHNQGYRVGRIFDHAYLAHRIIFAIVDGRFVEFIDHINGDRADNRWINLREATRKENQRNMKKPKTNKSGYVGVSQHRDGRWKAQIHADYKGHFLGFYSSLDDALTARRAAERLLGFHKNHGRQG